MENTVAITQSKLENFIDETPRQPQYEEPSEQFNGQNGKQDFNKIEHCDNEITELLGSVTTHNCPGTRFSARVIQKMKQDQTRPATPPNDREQKKEEKGLQKTPSNIRANKPTWTNLERNLFFDALNEYGKDFEAIGNYINVKLKRKNAIDKTTHQVRQHYYQSYHKICKYVKFSDEVKKPVQELYALINYGEMRRKLQFVTDKHFMKLKHLVYQGHITVRCKGKNIRVKTPSCKALRRINQLDDTLEDIRLPSKIEVILSPSNMETFGRLQTIAQNPRVRCMVPLHKKLVNLIKTFQYKWRSPESRLTEDDVKLLPNEISAEKREEFLQNNGQDTEICFQPKNGVTIHRPLLSITEHLSSVNICLSAYEERFGVRIRSESLCQDRNNTKRQRTDSGSEKRSPEAKKVKILPEKAMNSLSDAEHPLIQVKSESSSDELNDDIVTELLSDNDVLNLGEGAITSTTANGTHLIQPAQQIRTKRSTIAKTIRGNSTANFKPLLNPDAIRRIRQGWTVTNAGDITIGDLYVVLGQDSRLELEYYWTEQLSNEKLMTAVGTTTCATAATTTTMIPATTTAPVSVTTSTTTENLSSVFTQKQTGIPYNPTECNDPQILKTISRSTIGNKLKHLLLIANLSERIRKRQCSCGHICERNAVKARIVKPIMGPGLANDNNKSIISSARIADNGVFRQPNLPLRRPIYNMDPVKQLVALSGQKMSRQVFVQRLILPGGASTHQTQESDSDKQLHMDHGDETQKDKAEHVSTASSVETVSTTAEKSIADNTVESSKNVCSFAGTVEAFSMSAVSNQNYDLPTSQNTPTSTDSAIDDCSNAGSLFNGMSPMHLLRETTSNSRWLEDNFNDFSLTSLLGHLDEINGNRDIVDPSNLSVISESSVDYMHKFQEISALMQRQDKD